MRCSAWDTLAQLEKNNDFVVVTTEYPHEELRPHKVSYALFFFTVALCLVLFTDLRLSVALFTGAMGMVLSGVLNIEEAYKAVSWKTVFLLASLIPPNGLPNRSSWWLDTCRFGLFRLQLPYWPRFSPW